MRFHNELQFKFWQESCMPRRLAITIERPHAHGRRCAGSLQLHRERYQFDRLPCRRPPHEPGSRERSACLQGRHAEEIQSDAAEDVGTCSLTPGHSRFGSDLGVRPRSHDLKDVTISASWNFVENHGAFYLFERYASASGTASSQRPCAFRMSSTTSRAVP
jgi:hypothetical protein